MFQTLKNVIFGRTEKSLRIATLCHASLMKNQGRPGIVDGLAFCEPLALGPQLVEVHNPKFRNSELSELTINCHNMIMINC